MDEVDTAYLNQRLTQLESNQKLQADLYLIERTSGKRWSTLWAIFQVLWLLSCTVLITIILTDRIPEIHNKVDKERLPVGTIMAWDSTHEPPEGTEKAIVLHLKSPELRKYLTIT